MTGTELKFLPRLLVVPPLDVLLAKDPFRRFNTIVTQEFLQGNTLLTVCQCFPALSTDILLMNPLTDPNGLRFLSVLIYMPGRCLNK